MVHTLFLTDLRNFNPTKYTPYTVSQYSIAQRSLSETFLSHIAKNKKNFHIYTCRDYAVGVALTLW